jgi:hypothetical protein
MGKEWKLIKLKAYNLETQIVNKKEEKVKDERRKVQ